MVRWLLCRSGYQPKVWSLLAALHDPAQAHLFLEPHQGLLEIAPLVDRFLRIHRAESMRVQRARMASLAAWLVQSPVACPLGRALLPDCPQDRGSKLIN